MGRHQQPLLELACDQPLLHEGNAQARQCCLYAQVGVRERQRLAQGHGLAREGFPLVPGTGRVLMCNARAVGGPAPGIGRRAHGAEVHGRQFDGAVAVGLAVGGQVPGNDQVGALVAHLARRGHGQADADMRVAAVEHRQLRHQPAHGKGGAAGYMQPRCLGVARQLGIGGLQMVEGRAHRGMEGGAGLGQAQARAFFLEQRRARVLLQQAQVAADGAVAAAQFLGRAGHRAGAGNGLEGAQGGQRWQLSHGNQFVRKTDAWAEKLHCPASS